MANMSTSYGAKPASSGAITTSPAATDGDDSKEYASARLLELTGVIGFNGNTIIIDSLSIITNNGDDTCSNDLLTWGNTIRFGLIGSVPSGLLLHPGDKHIIYPLGSTIVVRNLVDNTQTFLSKGGHNRAVSCLSLSVTGKYLASGQMTHMGFPVRSSCHISYCYIS